MAESTTRLRRLLADELGTAATRTWSDGRGGLLSGDTRPADRVRDEAVAAMSEAGFDLSDRTPRGVTTDEPRDADLVITMGCSARDVCPATWGGESRDWDLDDPHGESPERVGEIRDEVENGVGTCSTG